MPCLDCWNAFILACISDGKPPPALILDRDVAAAGLRALLIVPRGVEEGVINANEAGSETERREGSRGV